VAAPVPPATPAQHEGEPRFLTLPPDDKIVPGPLEKVGSRTITIGERSRSVPWFRIQADCNAIRLNVVWPKLPSPQGTTAAYVGYYGKLRWCEWSGGIRAQVSSLGVNFLRAIRPCADSREVMIRHWLFEEQRRQDGMALREGQHYVFCFDRRPEADAGSKPEYPACNLGALLPHLIGIIAVVPTFDFAQHPRSEALHVTAESLRSFCKKWPWRQEMALTRQEDSTLRLETSGRLSVVAPSELVQKLLYALNTCSWRRQEKAHETNGYIASETRLTYEGSDGELRTATILYDHGGWFMTDSRASHYGTIHPHLLYEILAEARELCGE
jgi:hypothetical protein